MADIAVWLMIATSAVVLAAAVALFGVKAVRRRRERRRLRRHNRYVDLIGDLLVRDDLSRPSLHRLAKSEVFRGAVMEYLRFLEGDERDRLVDPGRHSWRSS